MASNAFANAAAAVTAGYKEIVTDRGFQTGPGVGAQIPARFKVELVGEVVGQPGVGQTGEVSFSGEGASQAAAEVVATANLNAWRANRYGSDSAGVNTSTMQTAATSPNTQGVAPTHGSLTKDKH